MILVKLWFSNPTQDRSFFPPTFFYYVLNMELHRASPHAPPQKKNIGPHKKKIKNYPSFLFLIIVMNSLIRNLITIMIFILF